MTSDIGLRVESYVVKRGEEEKDKAKRVSLCGEKGKREGQGDTYHLVLYLMSQNKYAG